MNLTNDEIYSLIAKSFSGELTGEELAQLNAWKSSDRSNLSEYNDFLDIWNHSNRLAMPSPFDLPGSLNTTRKIAGIDRGQVCCFGSCNSFLIDIQLVSCPKIGTKNRSSHLSAGKS